MTTRSSLFVRVQFSAIDQTRVSVLSQYLRMFINMDTTDGVDGGETICSVFKNKILCLCENMLKLVLYHLFIFIGFLVEATVEDAARLALADLTEQVFIRPTCRLRPLSSFKGTV
jgi:hypothetical protein